MLKINKNYNYSPICCVIVTNHNNKKYGIICEFNNMCEKR